MERKFLNLQNEVSEHREEVKRNRDSYENTIQRLEQDVGTNCKTLEQTLLSFKSCFADCVTPKSPPSQQDSITSTTLSATTTTTTVKPTTTITMKPKQSYLCKEIASKNSGVYLIRVSNDSAPFKAFCEMESYEGGWIVIQHRFNGSVDFYRNWTEYRDGFGELDSEFWLGLEHIHQITTARAHEIVIEMMDFEDNYRFAHYNAFQVGSESEQYSLKTLGSYYGTAGDSMTNYNKGAKFSTKDRDNDGSTNNLAAYCEGAWWYSTNSFSNLNGPYKFVDRSKSIWWSTFQNGNHLSYSRMMIR
ncbi:fibrinogen-like protein A [Anopheles aquasalis]|uniref:fibrinogen-like protein A n=1 Tax=Anopheles aquasalis TaxID=42839 RepID=UPI00215AF2DB|nr:fibrinogen-like protein A [Anopheles aquasalis]